MAKRYTLKQGALGGVAARDIGFDIPEEGEVFKDAGSNQLMYMRGGQIYRAPSGFLTNEEKVAMGGSPRVIEAEETKRFLEQAGVDYGGDVNKFLQGLRPQNVGDLTTAGLVKVQNQSIQFGEGKAQDFKSIYDAFVSGSFGKAAASTETITGPGAKTFKDVPPGTPTPGAGGVPATKGAPVEGFPGNQTEYQEWLKMGRAYDAATDKWYEKTPTGQPGAPDGGVAGGGEIPGGGGEIPGGGEGPDIPSLAFNLDNLVTGEFNTDDLIDIFSSPITSQDIDKLLDENQKLRQKFLDSLEPTDVEIKLKADLADLRNEIETEKLGYRKGVADIKQELVSTRVMAGEEEALYTQAQLGMQTLAIQEANLLTRLGLEQGAREATAKIMEATLGFNDADINRMMTMQNQIWNQKMALYNVMSQFSTRAQNTLNLVLDGLQGLDAADLDNNTITKLQSLVKSAGIPWEVVQQAMKVNKDEYSYNEYVADLDKRIKEVQLEKLEGGDSTDFTESQKLKLEQAGIDWRDPVGRQKALDFLYKEGPADVEEMMTQYKDLIQQYKDNEFSKEDAEEMVRSENGIKEDENIPGPYQDIIDEVYEGKISKEKGGWKQWLIENVWKRMPGVK